MNQKTPARPHRIVGYLAMAVTATVFLAGCGDADPDAHEASGDPPPAPADAPRSAEADPEADEDVVVIRMLDDMTFDPEHPEINAGDRVVWVNEGDMPHTATAEPGRAANPDHNVLPDGAAPFDSGMLEAGERFSHVFEVPGEYTYLCWLHEALGMVGHLTVR